MSNSNDSLSNLMYGLSIAQTANIEAQNAQDAALAAQARASAAELKLAGKTTDRDLERRLSEAKDALVSTEYLADALSKSLAEKEALIAEQKAEILDWMHSNEAFKRLAKQYGDKLGITFEKRQEDLDAHIVSAAEENPEYADTIPSKKAKARVDARNEGQ